jgi:hypothetical protein
MATFKLTINLDNAAFDEAPGEELARILEDVALHLTARDFSRGVLRTYTLCDTNGNDVGSYKFTGKGRW